jgi:predicted RNA polymerase sigma factor
MPLAWLATTARRKATMAQRLTRGKRTIRQSRIPFRVPGPDELEGRLGLVLHVVYLVFTEGYATTGHPDLVRCDLVDEAIRLARILHRLMPGELAISWDEGPQAGLDHLEALAGEVGLARQHRWHAARGHILARLGRHTAAEDACRRASELAQTPAEIAYLSSRAEEYNTPD